MTIRFGIDGWRAMASDTFTFTNLRLVVQAVADYVVAEAEGVPEVVVGFHPRFLSDRYAAEVARRSGGGAARVSRAFPRRAWWIDLHRPMASP